MKRATLASIPFLLILLMGGQAAFSCTTFCLKSKGELLFGNNYDYDIGDGLLMVNKRGVTKASTTDDEGNPAKWTSKYGSVTFNQFGRENPNGGINEKGLVVAIMWLNEAAYPTAGKQPTIDILEWVQYQLDTAATVSDVLQSTDRMRVSPDLPGIKIHYLVADAEGNAASVEYIGGKLVVHAGATLPQLLLTNNTYEDSLKYLKTTPIEKATTDGSLDRFARVSHELAELGKQDAKGKDPVAYAFTMLADAASRRYTTSSDTQWSIVYDQRRRVIYFRTLHNPAIRTVDTRAFDYSCGTPLKIFDVNSKDTGDVTAKFTDYTRKANRDLIEST